LFYTNLIKSNSLYAFQNKPTEELVCFLDSIQCGLFCTHCIYSPSLLCSSRT